ncbi:MAG: hypothetical protein VZR28_11165 [Candidatus Cryptobacteroides sp.]|nr:hypothetical protein [Bacteroidales bacterium]MEE3391724.1 hypothetical protein [Candidatus Cryptobacteroides sp.]
MHAIKFYGFSGSLGVTGESAMVAVYERAVVAPVTLITNILQRVASRSYRQAVERAVMAPVTLIMNILLRGCLTLVSSDSGA